MPRPPALPASPTGRSARPPPPFLPLTPPSLPSLFAATPLDAYAAAPTGVFANAYSPTRVVATWEGLPPVRGLVLHPRDGALLLACCGRGGDGGTCAVGRVATRTAAPAPVVRGHATALAVADRCGGAVFFVSARGDGALCALWPRGTARWRRKTLAAACATPLPETPRAHVPSPSKSRRGSVRSGYSGAGSDRGGDGDGDGDGSDSDDSGGGGDGWRSPDNKTRGAALSGKHEALSDALAEEAAADTAAHYEHEFQRKARGGQWGGDGGDSDVNVRVVLRCRPLLADEVAAKRYSVVQCSRTTVTVDSTACNTSKHHRGRRAFDFRKVYGPETTQRRIYKDVALPMVCRVLEGCVERAPGMLLRRPALMLMLPGMLLRRPR